MFICLDLETTGLNPKTDHIIEVAIVRFDTKGVIDRWSSLVKPPIPIPEFTTRLTGIDDSMVKDAPSLDELRTEILEKVGDLPVMGHFISFDLGFLNEHGFNLSNAQLDTCQFVQILLPNEASYSLEVLTKKFNIVQEDAHRALDDVEANIELCWKLFDHIRALSPKEKTAIQPILEKSTWSWAPHILPRLAEEGGSRLHSPKRERNVLTESHADLKALSAALTPPFLVEEASHTLQDLLNYALSLDGPVTLSVPDLSLLPQHPELASIKHPNDYLSESRLQKTMDKPELDPTQSMLGLKLTLWAMTTDTGEKQELRIIKEEKDTWYDVCCQVQDEPESFFKKAREQAAQKKITALTHHYFLQDRARSHPQVEMAKHVVIGETERLIQSIERSWHISLSESRLLNELHRLRELNPQCEVVLDHIAAKISIFFGFLGMTIQRHGEPETEHHLLVIEPQHRNTAEWDKVKQSAQSIAAALSALSNELTHSAHLEELEKNLNFLQKIVQSGTALWLTASGDQLPIVHSFPEQSTELFQERVWKGIQNLHLFCHRGNLRDDFHFFKQELGLPEQLQTHTVEAITPLPLYTPTTKISGPNDPRNIPEVVHEISLQLPNLEGNIFLMVTSKHAGEQFFYKLEKPVKATGRKLFVQNLGGGMGKIFKMAQDHAGSCFFVGTEDFMGFLMDEGMPLQHLMIHRLPFAPPSDPIQMARSKKYTNAYKEFTVPQTTLSYQGILSKFLGNQWEGKSILILDPRTDLLR
jgi:DNA polymerase III epsilon subunit family exonuclease